MIRENSPDLCTQWGTQGSSLCIIQLRPIIQRDKGDIETDCVKIHLAMNDTA